jgi:PAS domain S-box-containing protein
MASSPADVVRRAFQALTAHDLEALAGLLDADAVQDVVPDGVQDGRGAVLALYARVLGAMPDLRADIVHLAATDDTVLATWEVTGTFTGGPLRGIDPTGARIRLQGAVSVTVLGGRATGVQVMYDGAACARQVGLLPPRGSPEDDDLVAALNARTRMRDASWLSPEQLDDLLDQADIAVIATNLDGIVTHWNPAAERLYGWTQADVAGRPITTLTVGPEDAEVAQAIMAAVRRDGRWEGEFWVHHKDGARFLVHVREALLADEAGDPLGLVGVSVRVRARQPHEGAYRERCDDPGAGLSGP